MTCKCKHEDVSFFSLTGPCVFFSEERQGVEFCQFWYVAVSEVCSLPRV